MLSKKTRSGVESHRSSLNVFANFRYKKFHIRYSILFLALGDPLGLKDVGTERFTALSQESSD